MCLCKRPGQQQAQRCVFTCSDSSALNSGRQRCVWHGYSHLCLSTAGTLTSIYSSLSLSWFDNMSTLFFPRPFSVGVRLWSLLLPSEHQRCWRGLPSHLPPRTSLHLLQTGRCKRLTVGFRRLLFYCSVLLYASSLATPPLSALLAKYLWVQRRWAKTETDPFPWTQLILDRYSKGARVIGCVDIWDLLINEALAKKFWQEDNTVARP